MIMKIEESILFLKKKIDYFSLVYEDRTIDLYTLKQ